MIIEHYDQIGPPELKICLGEEKEEQMLNQFMWNYKKIVYKESVLILLFN